MKESEVSGGNEPVVSGGDDTVDLGQDIFAGYDDSDDSGQDCIPEEMSSGGFCGSKRAGGQAIGVGGVAAGFHRLSSWNVGRKVMRDGKMRPVARSKASSRSEVVASDVSKGSNGPKFKGKKLRIMPGDIDMGGSGRLDKETVKKYIRKQLAGIKWCYQKACQRNNKLGGKVAVAFIISVTGKVTKSKVASSTLGDKPLEACIEQKVLRWRFPEPTGGLVKVRYPFVLKPE